VCKVQGAYQKARLGNPLGAANLDNTLCLCYISCQSASDPPDRVFGATIGANNLKWGSVVKILVIDDSNTIRKTAESLLARAGHQVSSAADGFESLAKIADDPPDLIFVDIMMPRLDGYQTCALIKNNRRFRSIPVVMLSSKDGLFDKARGRIVGADAYLTKPFGRQDLLDVVDRMAEAQRPTAAAGTVDTSTTDT